MHCTCTATVICEQHEDAPYAPRCPECGRVFDLTIKAEADEWSAGHDCEAV